jgi:hypothetical protein
MKRCSTCKRTYTDTNLSFCIDDGTPLTVVDPQDETTVVSPRDPVTENNWNEAPYRPPAAYVPPQRKKRRVWPWVLGVGGVFALGMVAIAIAAVMLMPRFRHTEQNNRPVTTTEQRNTNQSSNSNGIGPSNPNSNANVNIDVPPPTDDELVMTQLRDLEHEWTLANINDDKAALDRILADDYVGRTDEGVVYGKADYIRTNERDVRVEKWDLDDLKLNLIGDRATLSGKIKYELRDEDDLKFEFLDKFVWRDGRWQATGSEVKRRE